MGWVFIAIVALNTFINLSVVFVNVVSNIVEAIKKFRY